MSSRDEGGPVSPWLRTTPTVGLLITGWQRHRLYYFLPHHFISKFQSPIWILQWKNGKGWKVDYHVRDCKVLTAQLKKWLKSVCFWSFFIWYDTTIVIYKKCFSNLCFSLYFEWLSKVTGNVKVVCIPKQMFSLQQTVGGVTSALNNLTPIITSVIIITYMWMED